MSLSFEESLKNNNEEHLVVDEDIVLENENIETASIMAYSMRSIPALLMDNDGWEKPSNYANYEYLNGQYADEDYSTIDDNKNIQLSSNQINITQEKNSQYIPFKIPRKYDGFDLANTTFSIYYVNKNKQWGKDVPVDVYCNEDSIKFAWLVGERATAVSGILQFEIHAVGKNRLGNDYVWKTKSIATLNVIQSLEEIADGQIGLTQADAEDLYNKISKIESNVHSYLNETKDALNQAQGLVDDLNNGIRDTVEDVLDDKIGDVVNESIANELDNYYTKLETYTKDEIEDAIENAVSAVDDRFGALVDDQNQPLTVQEYVAQEVAAVDISDQLGELGEYETVKDYVDAAVDAVDVSDQLGNLGTNSDNTPKTVKQYVDEAVDSVDVSDQLGDLGTHATVKDYVDDALDNISLDGYATENWVNNQITGINTNAESIRDINEAITDINDTLGTIDKTPNAYYVTTYDEPYSVNGVDYDGEDTLVLYKTNEADDIEARSYVAAHVIKGGTSGVVTSSNRLVARRLTPSPYIVTSNDRVIIEYEFEGLNAANEDIQFGYATWKLGNKTINQEISTSINMPDGKNSIDITKYIGVGSNQKLTLTITDDVGSAPASTFWYISVVDMKLESNFNDRRYYDVDSPVDFTFTPYGAVEKTVHFVLDGEEIGTKTISENNSGRSDSYRVPNQKHGAHLLEAYMTAEINGKTIGLEEIVDEDGEITGYDHTIKVVKDIVWFDSTSNIPVIGCATPVINAIQHNTVNIKYTVFDASTETPTVIWSINGVPQSPEILTEKDKDGYYTYPYKASEAGTFVFTINCGAAEPKTITVNVEELNIDVSPVTKNLAFDFNPSSNTDKLWSSDGQVSMTTSDNFDWVNGGYQIDEESGDQCFCVKAGTTATIDYKLFANDPKADGKEFKVIFKTKNIRRRDTSFLTCLNGGIGLDMKIENATVYNSLGSLKSDYCENTIIEYEFNINKSEDMRIVMSYEDGAPSKPCEYAALASFRQSSAQPITIGSADCDVIIYRMKAYSSSLTDTDIMDNFIADARSADEMLSRYNRNQIYTNGSLISTSASGDFNVDALMKAAPDLRYIFLEVPQFTNDKDNKIDDCTVYFRYPNGTRPHDNWDCTGVRHRGQGTSSNSYGYAGRNIDLCMDRDESLFTYTDEQGNKVNSRTITLTDTSVPTDYLNIKVNIASSENANNAEMARRYNEYQPFLRYARKKDSKVKDTMEFYNCVVFIRETGDTAIHREFNDTNWHFYAIGNVGDSKKSDDTRVNNANDPKEHVIEIADVDKPLYNFPTGKEANAICPVSEWKAGNTAYDILHSQEYVYDSDGEFESFGGTTFEFRYEMDGITEEQREININIWRDLYKFIVTSTDEEFYSNLKNYFVVDSALYYYLFTERYTMVDNRAKNSFWHYGKVYISETEAAELGETEASYYIIDNAAAAINDGYRYDLTFGYDFDTALGIDNTGDYVFSYGKEDTDYYDGSSSKPVFRAMDSTFFCRLRDLFPSEMQAMFKNREERNAWNSGLLIAQWDNSQAQFPEELWRLDYERKYYRTYLGLSIDNSIIPSAEQTEGQVEAKTYLVGKFFGRKKYARRAFETNQEMYFATKYFGQKALGSVFWIRGNTYGGNDDNLKQNYSLTLVPYSDMYLCMQYSSTGTPIHSVDENGKPKRIKAGESYTFVNNEATMDFIYVYAANWIQEVADLSRCYFDDNDFSAATRLQKLVIGSTDAGYDNPNMTNILVGNNQLLEHLDLRNVSGINSVIDVSGCSNLKELYAEGTNAIGVIFADGGLLHTAHLPNTIKSLSMKNLNYIHDENFVVGGYGNLLTLIVENTPNINTYNIVNNAPELDYVRLIGLNWNAESSILSRLFGIDGIDSSGNEIDQSVLTGTITVPTLGGYELKKYRDAWSDLTIYLTEGETPQFKVTFVNDDGTVLDTQYILQYGSAIDPCSEGYENRIVPTKESTIQYQYNFVGWDEEFTNITEDIIVTAQYEEKLREYTIRYASMGQKIIDYENVPYGENRVYKGDIPTYTAAEPSVFYLFKGWDKSGFATSDFDENGIKTINAVFDRFDGGASFFKTTELSKLTHVQLYALLRLSKAGNVNIGDNHNQDDPDYEGFIADGSEYSFSMGNDFEYGDIDSVLLVNKQKCVINNTNLEDIPRYGDGKNNGVSTVFTGSHHIDTGIKLFDTNKEFVLAMDYEFTNNVGTLAQCCDVDSGRGFRLWYNTIGRLTYDEKHEDLVETNKREMIVLRNAFDKEQGKYMLTVYKSNFDGDDISFKSLPREIIADTDMSLILGAAMPELGTFNNSKGNINWAKLWYADLGEDACKSLAMWVHEDITMQACGFNRYYLSETSGRCSFSLLATHLLGRTMAWQPKDSVNGTNDGGWAASDLNTFLNDRFYNSIPVNFRSLLKRVKVRSTDGVGSSIVESDCYVTIPALVELCNDYRDTEPYNDEIKNGEDSSLTKCVSYIKEVSTEASPDRTRKINGVATEYWTRSPSIGYSNYVCYIDATGMANKIGGYPYYSKGVLIELSL